MERTPAAQRARAAAAGEQLLQPRAAGRRELEPDVLRSPAWHHMRVQRL